MVKEFCPEKPLSALESLSFLTAQNVKTVLTRVADTAGTNAHKTYGENIRKGVEKGIAEWLGLMSCLMLLRDMRL